MSIRDFFRCYFQFRITNSYIVSITPIGGFIYRHFAPIPFRAVYGYQLEVFWVPAFPVCGPLFVHREELRFGKWMAAEDYYRGIERTFKP